MISQRTLPQLYFFRHVKGIYGVVSGQKFGKKYLYKCWKKACLNHGIEGMDLYDMRRHLLALFLKKKKKLIKE